MMTINTFTTIRPEDEQLGMTKNVAYGLQHVLTMYGGIIAVPQLKALPRLSTELLLTVQSCCPPDK